MDVLGGIKNGEDCDPQESGCSPDSRSSHPTTADINGWYSTHAHGLISLCPFSPELDLPLRHTVCLL